nr:hypothetical protein [Ralstonia mannitolilytica]
MRLGQEVQAVPRQAGLM